MKILKLATLSVAVCTFLAAQNFPNRGPIPFNSFDINGDNIVTSKEFYKVRNDRMTQKAQQNMPMRNAGNAPSFEDMDKNGDGKLTKEEFDKFRSERMQQMQRGKGMPGGNNGQGMGRMMNNK
ncbi:EF-hand domain-containing protein [Arcobacter sp. CECT 8985]|uniref:EF-hand domain-containing protein n=1 Tax=Arcobacter sp. CECT 8985 TaxID=1935424 RepID=UPI00100BC003|nr:EF-hand domain-containing protein [Arcobacter sp. CECT 8985]RXJ88225.1 hypothetical protein CRU93_01110 [Arcobacter sp. CECT 8985]